MTSVLVVAVGLAMDCFAVAVGSGMTGRRVGRRFTVRAAMSFGIFQGGMLALGWLAASSIERFISTFDHWVAFSLLAFVGVRAIWGTVKKGGTGDEAIDVTKGPNLLLLSVATSIDALAVGLGLGLAESDLVVTSLIVGAVTFLLASVGFYLGQKTGSLLGKPARLVGGLILVGIGIRILVGHTWVDGS